MIKHTNPSRRTLLKGAASSALAVGLSILANVALTNAACGWDIQYSPPPLVSPTTLYLPGAASLTYDTAFNSAVCSGYQYHLNISDNTKDYIIRMKPGATALKYPLYIKGGHSARVIGLAIDLVVQPACAIGMVKPNGKNPSNIHPLTPGGRALFVAQTNSTYIEGAYIRMNGIESDCINGWNPGNLTVDQELAQRDYVFEASQCADYTGTVNSLHADTFQQQYAEGAGVTRNLVFENFTSYSGMEGIIHESNNSVHPYGVMKLVLRNMNYTPSLVVPPSSVFINNLPAADVATPSKADVTFSNYWVNTFTTMYCWQNGGTGSFPSTYNCKYNPGNTPGMFSGTPPGGDYASASRIGLNYVSPFP